ncbi:hypothetical protein RDV89_13290 [Nocardioides zeae]|uniref:Uncharacterized protein n=1 Tax=Nocardioides imazamoxiresistens TaxID=3231893 RepID=A0ABU3PYV0_9ACTN|nr:hypothetical protein [Nocardioides zeae]MDT9594051.1 hypothetical protein [Nocardioides zeae]
MHPDSNGRREALRLVRRGAAASLVGGLAWAGWEAARAVVPAGAVRDRIARLRGGGDDLDFVPDVEPGDWETRELDADVRLLTDALLSQTEDFGALALRAQLLRAATTDARRHPQEPVDFQTFEVPDDVPFAVPADAEFPVRARFVGPDGEAYAVSLRVDEGRLAYLRLAALDGGGTGGPTPVRTWPAPAEVTFWIDTIKGPEPVLR